MTKSFDYPVQFWADGNLLHQSMQRLPATSYKIRNPNKSEIKSIAKQLAFMHRCGLVHGDINAKNIWNDGKKAILLDYEPSLIQLRKGRICMMGTAPRVHPFDRKKMKLTELSDRLGFICWATGLPPKEAVHLTEISMRWGTLLDKCLSIKPSRDLNCLTNSAAQ